MINKSRNAKQPCATCFIIFNRPTYLLTNMLKPGQMTVNSAKHFQIELLIFADPAFVFYTQSDSHLYM